MSTPLRRDALSGVSWLAVLVGLLFVPAQRSPRAAPPEPAKEGPKPMSTSSPLPHPVPFGGNEDDRRHGELVVDFGAFARFRTKLSKSLRAVRARKRLPEPFDPRFAQIHRGVAFRAKVHGEERWLTSGPLAIEVLDLEVRAPDGTWHRAEPASVCKEAHVAVLEPLGQGRPLGEAPPIPIRSADDLRELLPVLALSNLEGTSPVLDHGRLIRRAAPPIERAWLSNLKLAPGTPLLDASGRALLMRVIRGAAAYDVPIRLDLGCEKASGKETPEGGAARPEGGGVAR